MFFLIPRKFLPSFFVPFSTFLRNDTPFYALNGKKLIQISLFPDFCLIFARKLGTDYTDYTDLMG